MYRTIRIGIGDQMERKSDTAGLARRAFVVLVTLSCATSWAITEPLISSGDAWPGQTLADGKFFAYIPDSVEVLRFMIFRHQAPLFSEGRDKPDHDITCMAVSSKCGFFRVPEGSGVSGSEVEAFLTKLGTETGHPEIPNLPVMSDGETNDMPKDHLCSIFGERFFGHYGWTGKASYTSSCPNLVTFHIPEEGNSRIGTGGGSFYGGSGDKPQMKLYNWGWPHGYYGKKCILWPMYFATMELRVPSDWDPLQGPPDTKTITFPGEDEWRGVPARDGCEWPEIYPRSEYPGDPQNGVWLPSEDFAFVWRAKASRHPTDVQHDQGEANFATMNNADLSGQPALMITSPARPYHSKLSGGKNYPLYPLNASIDVTFKNGFYNGATLYDAASFKVYDGKYLLKEVPAGDGRKTYVARNCILRNTGPRSLIVIAELKNGGKVTSRPVPVYVTDSHTADPADTLRPEEHVPVSFEDGVLNPELLATSIGTEVPSWNWRMAPTVAGSYDENDTYSLKGNGHAIYMCWDRAGYAFTPDGLDGDFVFFGRLAQIPDDGPGAVALTVKGGIDGTSPVLDLRWDYYWQNHHPEGVGLSWFNRHTPANLIGTHDQGQRGGCDGYPEDRRATDTVCVYKQGCLGRGFENRVPGFTSREDLWLAVKRIGEEFFLFARYGEDTAWTSVDPTPMTDSMGSQGAVNLWPNFIVPPVGGTKVYAGFSVVGVEDGQHIMEAEIDNITLLTSRASIDAFPNYEVAATIPPRAGKLPSAKPVTSYADGRLLTFHADVESAKLFSADGRCVMRVSPESSRKLVKIPVNVSPGIYVLQFTGPIKGATTLYIR